MIGLDAFLADSVSGEDGKLHALGAGWNRLLFTALPAVHDRIGIGLVLRIPPAESGREHELAVILEGPDGEAAAPGVRGTFALAVPDPLDEELLPLAINLDAVRIEQPGRYRFVVSIDGAEVRALPFAVALQDGPSSG